MKLTELVKHFQEQKREKEENIRNEARKELAEKGQKIKEISSVVSEYLMKELDGNFGMYVKIVSMYNYNGLQIGYLTIAEIVKYFPGTTPSIRVNVAVNAYKDELSKEILHEIILLYPGSGAIPICANSLAKFDEELAHWIVKTESYL